MKSLIDILRLTAKYSSIHFIDESSIWPKFGSCDSGGIIRVRKGMGNLLTLGIIYHELAHRQGRGELGAHLLTLLYCPLGYAASFLASLRWYRIRFYYLWVRHGKIKAENKMRAERNG